MSNVKAMIESHATGQVEDRMPELQQINIKIPLAAWTAMKEIAESFHTSRTQLAGELLYEAWLDASEHLRHLEAERMERAEQDGEGE